MNKKLLFLQVCLVLICSVILADSVCAKTWFLPDYMEKETNTYKKRANDASGPQAPKSECARFKDSSGQPLRSETEIASGHTCTPYPNIIVNKVCVGNCKCDPARYIYSSANCNGNYKPSGSKCIDSAERYTACLCNEELFPHAINKGECKFGDTAAGVCNDKGSNLAHYKACYPDTCFKYTDLVDEGSATCPYGCPSFADDDCSKCRASSCGIDDCHKYSDPATSTCGTYGCKTPSSSSCTDKCRECNKACDVLHDNTGDYGCAKKWDDCPSKCEIPEICNKRDCAAEGYEAASCPANANCGDPCQAGCGDTTSYYKYGTCDIGYIDLEKYWCDGAVKCFWDGSFVSGVDVCESQGYTGTVLTPPPGMTIMKPCLGQKIEYCPSDSSRYKCVAQSCEEQGYLDAYMCHAGQTIECCPSDPNMCRCVGEPTSCADLGYSSGDQFCLIGQIRDCCWMDSSMCRCTGDPLLPITCAGYEDCSTLFCKIGETSKICSADNTKCRCVAEVNNCAYGFPATSSQACLCIRGIKQIGSTGCYECCSVSDGMCIQCAVIEK